MRRTKIIATLGPAIPDEETFLSVLLAGADVIRFNFSHDSYDTHLSKLNRLSALRERIGKPVAALLDTRGPEIRIGTLPGNQVMLTSGQTVVLTPDAAGGSDLLPVSHTRLAEDVHIGSHIFLDDGNLELIVKETRGLKVICRVINDGIVRSHKSVNVPDTALSLPYLSDRDREDLLFGIRHHMDFVAASFVRSADDIELLRKFLSENGGRSCQIIAKIECRQGVENAEKILAAADGIMIARGDMGVEVPLEEVPTLQKRLIALAHAAAKPSIVATHLLESMTQNPRPTRAEVNDVAGAVWDGASAVMLSGETAAGRFPAGAVRTLDRILSETEKSVNYSERFTAALTCAPASSHSLTEAVALAAGVAASRLSAQTILTVTQSGRSARLLSGLRPPCPLIAFCENDTVCRQLNLAFGVTPLKWREGSSNDTLIHRAVALARESELISDDDAVVAAVGIPYGTAGLNLIKAGWVTDL